MKRKPRKFLFVFFALISMLVVSCELVTDPSSSSSSVVPSSSVEPTSTVEESSDVEELEIVFAGLADSNHFVGDVVDVLLGVSATGSDSNDYTADISVSSENCTIVDNKITADTPRTCVVNYLVLKDEKEFKGRKNFIFAEKEKELTTLTITGAENKSIFVDTTFNVLTGITVTGDDDKDYTASLTYTVIEGASIDTTTNLLNTSIVGETTIKYEVKVGEIEASKIITVEVKEKGLFKNDLMDSEGIVENGELEMLRDNVTDTFHIWRVLDAGWGCGPVVNVPYAIHDGQLDVDVIDLNGNDRDWSVQLFYLTEAIAVEGVYTMEFDLVSSKARDIKFDRRTNWEAVTLGRKTATMLDMNAEEQIPVSLNEGSNHIKVRFMVDEGEQIMLKVLLGLIGTEDASEALLTFKNFNIYKDADIPLTSITITGPANKTLPKGGSGYDLLAGVSAIGDNMKDYTSSIVVSSETGTIVNGILDTSEAGEFVILYKVTVGELVQTVQITIKVESIDSYIEDGEMNGTLGENWKFTNPVDGEGVPYIVKFEPTIEEGEFRITTEVGPRVGSDGNCPFIFQDITGLEMGATYKVTFKAKSTVARSVILRIRNSATNQDLTDQRRIELTPEYKLFEYEFILSRNFTDGNIGRLVIYMGEAWGRAEGEHVVTYDDFTFIKTKDAVFADPDNIFADGLADGHSFIKDGSGYRGRPNDWAYSMDDNKIVSERTFADNKLTITIDGLESQVDWVYIIFYRTLAIKETGTYVVTYTVNSTTNRRIVFDNSNDGCANPVTGRTDVALQEGEHTYSIEYNVNNPGQAIMLKILLGPKTDAQAADEVYNGTLVFSNISITKKA